MQDYEQMSESLKTREFNMQLKPICFNKTLLFFISAFLLKDPEKDCAQIEEGIKAVLN